METVECDNCGADVEKYPSQIDENNFCDKQCYGKWRSQHTTDPDNHYEFNCKTCGSTTTTPMAWVRKHNSKPEYCSKDCRSEDKRETRICEAPDCDETFTVPQHREKQFCSMDCVYGNRSRSHTREYMMTECQHCGENFECRKSRVEERRYCSVECKAKAATEFELFECENCGTEFKDKPAADRVYCGYECMNEHQQRENHPAWNGGAAKFYGDNWHTQREKAWERDGYSCLVCGSGADEAGSRPDVHHIVPIAEFDDLEAANRLDNLATLCRSHHRMVEGWGLLPPNIKSVN